MIAWLLTPWVGAGTPVDPRRPLAAEADGVRFWRDVSGQAAPLRQRLVMIEVEAAPEALAGLLADPRWLVMWADEPAQPPERRGAAGATGCSRQALATEPDLQRLARFFETQGYSRTHAAGGLKPLDRTRGEVAGLVNGWLHTRRPDGARGTAR